MKNLKISLSVFALALGLGFTFLGSASVKANRHLTTSWFQYDGTGSVSAPGSYTEVSAPTCPTGFVHLCAIQAPVGSGSKPVIDADLTREINTAVDSGNPSANVELKP